MFPLEVSRQWGIKGVQLLDFDFFGEIFHEFNIQK
eukprot:UN09865